MRRSPSRYAFGVLFAAVLGAGFADAQEPKIDKKPAVVEEKNPPEDKQFDRAFWDTTPGLELQATLYCTGPGNVFGALSARVMASENRPYLMPWRFEFTKVIPLNARNLSVIADHRLLPDLRAVDFKEIHKDLKLEDQGFYFAYIEALWRSHLTTIDRFEKSAEENADVVYSQLASDARRYRGKIITVKGRLTRLEARDAPFLVQDEGIDKVYMGEIHGPNPRMPSFVAVFTNLPEGLKPAPVMNRSVTFQGYFLANVRFSADKGSTNKDVSHPYLVGNTLSVHDQKDLAPPVEETSHSYVLIVSTLGGIVAVVFIGVLLSLWFRRSDHKIRSQLADVRDKHRPFSLEPDSPADAAPPETPKDPV